MTTETIEKREKGKLLYFAGGSDPAQRLEGIRLLDQASREGDAEAMYILGVEMLRGRLKPKDGDRVQGGLALLEGASFGGYLQARSILNKICESRYRAKMKETAGNRTGNTTLAGAPEAHGPLRGFDGKVLKIDRKGIFTPVDAELACRGGENVLTLSANIHFLYAFGEDEEKAFDRQLFESAVLCGFGDWQGDYEVFGGQKVRVEIRLSRKDRWIDSVHVIPVTGELQKSMERVFSWMPEGEARKRSESTIRSSRSFAAAGRRWTVNSGKSIWMQSVDGFRNADELRSVARHEFGHVLGLGDLYACEEDGLAGVEAGRYPELAGFHLFDRMYYLVMCDHHAPVSNNDIEMVLLAFSENKFQRFQPDKQGTKVSDALGAGD